VLLDPDLGIF